MIGDDPSAKGGSGRPAGKSPWILDDNGDLGPVDEARVAPATEVDEERARRSEWLVDAPEADAVAAQPKPVDRPTREPDPAAGKAAECMLASLEARIVELEAELARRVSADEELTRSLERLESDASAGRDAERKLASLEARMVELEAELGHRVGADEELTRSLDRHEEQFARETDSLRSALEGTEGRLARLKRQVDELEHPAPREAPAAAATRPERSGTPSINEVSFEELRQAGLSVTLAARLIAFRDARGGLKSFDELDQVRGLSAQQRQELIRSLRL